MKYLYGMISKDTELVEQILRDSSKENVKPIVKTYDQIDLDDYLLRLIKRKDELLIKVVYDGDAKNKKDRVIAYHLLEEKVFKDEETHVYTSDM